MFLKNKNIIFKIRTSKVTDYAALNTTTNLNVFFRDVNFSVNGNREILLKMYVHFKRDLLENQNYHLF